LKKEKKCPAHFFFPKELRIFFPLQAGCGGENLKGGERNGK
jgi:hypothetical protein